MKSLAKKEERSALWKHCKEKHNNEMQKFEMKVTASYSNDATLRQISEGVWIDQVPEGLLMNSTNKWNYLRIPHSVVPRKNRIHNVSLHDNGKHADYFSAPYLKILLTDEARRAKYISRILLPF